MKFSSAEVPDHDGTKNSIPESSESETFAKYEENAPGRHDEDARRKRREVENPDQKGDIPKREYDLKASRESARDDMEPIEREELEEDSREDIKESSVTSEVEVESSIAEAVASSTTEIPEERKTATPDDFGEKDLGTMLGEMLDNFVSKMSAPVPTATQSSVALENDLPPGLPVDFIPDTAKQTDFEKTEEQRTDEDSETKEQDDENSAEQEDDEEEDEGTPEVSEKSSAVEDNQEGVQKKREVENQEEKAEKTSAEKVETTEEKPDAETAQDQKEESHTEAAPVTEKPEEMTTPPVSEVPVESVTDAPAIVEETTETKLPEVPPTESLSLETPSDEYAGVSKDVLEALKNSAIVDEFQGIVDELEDVNLMQQETATVPSIPEEEVPEESVSAPEKASVDMGSLAAAMRSLVGVVLPETMVDDATFLTLLLAVLLLLLWTTGQCLGWFFERSSQNRTIVQMANKLNKVDSEKQCLQTENDELRASLKSEKRILREETGPRVNELEAQLEQSEQIYRELLDRHNLLSKRIGDLEDDKKGLSQAGESFREEKTKYEEQMAAFAAQMEANLTAQQKVRGHQILCSYSYEVPLAYVVV